MVPSLHRQSRTSAAPAHSACAELGGQVRKLPTSEQIGQVRHVSATGREVGRNLRQSMDGQRDRRLLRLRSQPDTQHEQRQFRVSIIKVSAGLHLSRLSLGLFLPASVCASVSECVFVCICLCVSLTHCHSLVSVCLSLSLSLFVVSVSLCLCLLVSVSLSESLSVSVSFRLFLCLCYFVCLCLSFTRLSVAVYANLNDDYFSLTNESFQLPCTFVFISLAKVM